MPAAIWRSIYETLKAELKEGVYPAGSKLPTESTLSQRFKVNRHTLRRALGALEEEGILSARRGSIGWAGACDFIKVWACNCTRPSAKC